MLVLTMTLLLQASPDAGAPMRRAYLDQLLARVKDGSVDTESERDKVKPEDMVHLARAYAETKRWREKTRLIELMQDSSDPVLADVWWDALDVPDCSDDVCWAVRAIALSHLDGDLTRFTTYYEDRKACRAAVQKRVAERKGRTKN